MPATHANCVAQWAIIEYALTVNTNNSSVARSPDAVDYDLTGHTVDNPLTITMPANDVELTVNFTQITHELTMATDSSGTTSPSVGTYTYKYGTVVDILATPDSEVDW